MAPPRPLVRRDRLLWTLVVAMAPLQWGVAFPAIKVALTGYDALEIATFRLVGAGLLLGFAALAMPVTRVPRRHLPALAAAGLLGFPAYQLLTHHGLASVPAGTGSVIVALVPLLATVFAWALYRSKVHRLVWVGLLLASAGVWVIAQGQGAVLRPDSGLLALLLASGAAGAYFAIEGRLLERYGTRTVLSYTIWLGALPLLPFVPGLGASLASAPSDATLALAYLVVFPTVVAYGVMAWGLSKVSTGEATSYIYLLPVFAYLAAWPLLGELPSSLDLVGGALCLLGVWVVQRKGRTAKAAAPEVSPGPVASIAESDAPRPAALRAGLACCCAPEAAQAKEPGVRS